MAPIVTMLLFVPTFTARFAAWILFLIAAFSDLWDGYLARKHGWISNFGKLVDPLADKLLLVCTFVPFYLISHTPGPMNQFPYMGTLPMWVVLVIFGREALITAIRSIAARRGVIIPAGPAGKQKAVFQNIFIGAAILWLALISAAHKKLWHGELWGFWQVLHGWFLLTALGLALLLTVYSMFVYLITWRRLAAQLR
jgi:CDP-diacylglycerol---glycerol-3-phosphate 3-phosphatidyltransferase